MSSKRIFSSSNSFFSQLKQKKVRQKFLFLLLLLALFGCNLYYFHTQRQMEYQNLQELIQKDTALTNIHLYERGIRGIP